MSKRKAGSDWHIFDHVYEKVPSKERKKGRKAVSPPHVVVENEELEPSLLAEMEFVNNKCAHHDERMERRAANPYDFPFIRQLLQQAPVNAMAPSEIPQGDKIRACVEVVHRAYEERFMREPLNDERACAAGEFCEGHKIHCAQGQHFTLREFLLPSEQTSYEQTKQWPTERRLCILCKRTEIAKAYFNIKADGMCVKADAILQDYRNIVGVPGEYYLHDCIVSGSTTYEGLLDPIVLHCRSIYNFKMENGVRWLSQHLLATPQVEQHFH